MFKIESLWAYVSENDVGDEGLCGYKDPRTGNWLPMVAGNHKHLQALKPFADQIAKLTKKKVKLVKFTMREDLGVIEP